MPFDWYHSKIPEWYQATFPEKRVKMYIEDIKVKARILKNLGYDKEYIKSRMRGNIRWAYEVLKVEPEYFDEIEAVVDKFFLR